MNHADVRVHPLVCSPTFASDRTDLTVIANYRLLFTHLAPPIGSHAGYGNPVFMIDESDIHEPTLEALGGIYT